MSMDGVYIPNMEMPKNCYECLVRNQGFSGDGMKCGKTGSVLSWYDGNRKRMDDCPLVPVPPHGDLIERDKLRAREFVHDGDSYAVVMSKDVAQAPTIIPATEGEQ